MARAAAIGLTAAGSSTARAMLLPSASQTNSLEVGRPLEGLSWAEQADLDAALGGPADETRTSTSGSPRARDLHKVAPLLGFALGQSQNVGDQGGVGELQARRNLALGIEGPKVVKLGGDGIAAGV